MAGGWNLLPSLANGQDLGAKTATSDGTILTSGIANTKGAWIQVILSSTNDISHLMVFIDISSAAGPTYALDIACAASGSEASGIILANYVITGGDSGVGFMLPVGMIKAGSRFAARFQSATPTETATIQLIGFDSEYEAANGAGLYDTYGWSGTVSAAQGLSIDPGATANTKGAYTALSASTTNDLAGFILGFDGQNVNGTVGLNGTTLVDLAIGAVGAEKIIVPNMKIAHNLFAGGVQMSPIYIGLIPMRIPAATRIAARAQSINTTVSTRKIGISLYGLRL